MSDDEKVSENKSQSVLLIVLIVFLISVSITIGVTTYVIKKKPEILGLSKGTQAIQAETEKLLAEVGKLISLPNDEKPTIATVSDVEKVKNQPFFKNAKNGDKVIIYTNAKKAILYRPSEKKIVEVGAVNINQQTKEDETQVESSPPSPEEKQN